MTATDILCLYSIIFIASDTYYIFRRFIKRKTGESIDKVENIDIIELAAIGEKALNAPKMGLTEILGLSNTAFIIIGLFSNEVYGFILLAVCCCMPHMMILVNKKQLSFRQMLINDLIRILLAFGIFYHHFLNSNL